MNLSHPAELAHLINPCLDGREITDDPAEPGLAHVGRGTCSARA
jgi:hypothetical protein